VHIHGLVVDEVGADPRVAEVELDEPQPGEVLVRLLASGVCHSDVHYQQGGLGDDFPYLLGHEGAGIVESCGLGVTSVAVGDYVALTYRAPCLSCRFCKGGRFDNCVSPDASKATPRLGDRPLSRALDLGTHATHVVVRQSQAIPIPSECPPEVACLLGCGVSTGVGAVLNTAGVWPGASVAVIGCGGVGSNVLQGARLARAGAVIAIDLSDSKLEQAREFGATHTVRAGGDTAAEVREITGGHGVDFAFDVVANRQSFETCCAMLDYRGTAVLVGFPHADAAIELGLLPFFYNGSTLKVSLGGDALPSRDLPLLAAEYLTGRLDLDRLVSRTISLPEVGDAFDAMLAGEVLRSVVRFPD
jgi:S-(hydroxymethyl)mycothiol dehydrogenase